MSEQVRTYQTRLSLSAEQSELLSRYAALYGRVERTLLAPLLGGESIAALKRKFIKRFGITARQFNAVAASLKGKIASAKETRERLIASSEQRIRHAEKVLGRITEPPKRHQKKRRLATLKARLTNLKADRDAGRIQICFGSRKLFREQFTLGENGFASHADWLAAWREARSSQIFVIGSRDETAGCQSCVAELAGDGSLSLRLRLPDALGAGKHLTISGVRLSHGHDAVAAAVGRNLSENEADWQAITYRFMRDSKGWRVFISVAVREPARISRKQSGAIGIDINADRLALAETDSSGNPVNSWSIPCVTHGLRSKRRAAVIGDAVKRAVTIAAGCCKPIVVEKLDFSRKKAGLEAESRKYSRMLSALAYSHIQATIRARAFDAGIEVLSANPAYSTVIGKHKFSVRYGLSAHQAAACVIARRVYGLSERLPRQLRVTLPLSARNRGRHVWSMWAVVSYRDRAAHGVLRRPGRKARSLTAPAGGQTGTARCEIKVSLCRCDSGTRIVLSTVRRTL